MTNPHAEIPRFVYVVAGIAAIGGLIFGYDIVVISGAILFIKNQFALSPTVEEVVVSAVVLGALFGAAVGGPLADRFGRRVVLMLIAVIFALGALGTALASTVILIIVGRVIVGASIGMVSMAAPSISLRYLLITPAVDWFLSSCSVAALGLSSRSL